MFGEFQISTVKPQNFQAAKISCTKVLLRDFSTEHFQATTSEIILINYRDITCNKA